MAKYTIILPVRNGGPYIKQCVDSILNQSLRDFQLAILDNNSTDGTLQWVQTINDSRVKVFPSSSSLPIEQNWGRILDVPKNEFITLIGHDDVLEPHYLHTMQQLIEKYPDASLYQAHFNYIDAAGSVIRPCQPMEEKQTAAQFLEKFLKKEIDVMGTGFMMRACDYQDLGGIPPYPNLLFADFELWISLAMKSYKATSPIPCFSFRLHQSMTTSSGDIKYQQAFKMFMAFLVELKNKSQAFEKVINEQAASFLLFYCQGLSHRLLRTPKQLREGLTVKDFINDCMNYASQLGIEKSFHPDKKISIAVAKMIDSNSFSRSLFLKFKKIYSKPILK
jgi:hypothetical protein